jgi:hypothetical protein
MSEKPISPLRQRMIEDMSVRNFVDDAPSRGTDLGVGYARHPSAALKANARRLACQCATDYR